jgi:hypothetical protein
MKKIENGRDLSGKIPTLLLEEKELEEEDEDGHIPSDIWIMINRVKLTYEFRAVLLTRFGWLTNDHFDTAQYLIKELDTVFGGLNCYAATTHCSRFALGR